MGLVLRALPLLVLYLVTVGSTAPGDLLVGGVLALAVAAAVRPMTPDAGSPRARHELRRVVYVVLTYLATLLAMVRGTWRMAPYCLTGRPPPHADLVEVPVGDRSPAALAGWGSRTNLSPDELVVDIDRDRGVAVVHVLDARDPDAVRARHGADRDRQRPYVR